MNKIDHPHYTTLDEHLAESLKDPVFKKHYEREKARLELALALAALRKKSGMSQKALGALLGTTQSVIARIEAGRENCTIDTVSRIAAALKKKVQVRFV